MRGRAARSRASRPRTRRVPEDVVGARARGSSRRSARRSRPPRTTRATGPARRARRRSGRGARPGRGRARRRSPSPSKSPTAPRWRAGDAGVGREQHGRRQAPGRAGAAGAGGRSAPVAGSAAGTPVARRCAEQLVRPTAFGYSGCSSAKAPATCGAANEVPAHSVHRAARDLHAGRSCRCPRRRRARRGRCVGPRLLKSAISSSRSDGTDGDGVGHAGRQADAAGLRRRCRWRPWWRSRGPRAAGSRPGTPSASESAPAPASQCDGKVALLASERLTAATSSPASARSATWSRARRMSTKSALLPVGLNTWIA